MNKYEYIDTWNLYILYIYTHIDYVHAVYVGIRHVIQKVCFYGWRPSLARLAACNLFFCWPAIPTSVKAYSNDKIHENPNEILIYALSLCVLFFLCFT